MKVPKRLSRVVGRMSMVHRYYLIGNHQSPTEIGTGIIGPSIELYILAGTCTVEAFTRGACHGVSLDRKHCCAWA